MGYKDTQYFAEYAEKNKQMSGKWDTMIAVSYYVNQVLGTRLPRTLTVV
jgi:hypothetical protein